MNSLLLQSDGLKQLKTIETARWDLVKGGCNRLIEVKITVIKEACSSFSGLRVEVLK